MAACHPNGSGGKKNSKGHQGTKGTGQGTRDKRDKGQEKLNQEDKYKQIVLNNLSNLVNTPRKRFMGQTGASRNKERKGQGTWDKGQKGQWTRKAKARRQI